MIRCRPGFCACIGGSNRSAGTTNTNSNALDAVNDFMLSTLAESDHTISGVISTTSKIRVKGMLALWFASSTTAFDGPSK